MLLRVLKRDGSAPIPRLAWTALAGLATLFGLAAGPSATLAAGRPAGEVVVALDSDPPTLNPNFHGAQVSTILTQNLFDALFHRDASGQIVPSLAVSWENPDSRTWVIHLRRGVRFHNGQELTADDVVYSIRRVLDPALGSPERGLFSIVESAQALDRYTVRIVTKQPSPIFKELFSSLFIVPKAYVEQVGQEAFARRPVGTGPYRFVEWRRDDRVVLEAFEGHWRGAPAVKRVVWRIIPERTTQIAELRTGGVDLVVGVLPDQIRSLEREPNVRVEVTPIIRTMFLQLDPTTPPLDDVRVRQALNYAVDKEAIVNNILGGLGTVLGGVLSPLHFGYDPSVKPYPYDPERARRLLAEAGYPDGFEIVFKATGSRIPYAREIVSAIQGYWADVGVRTRLEFYPEVGPWLQLWPDKVKPMAMASWGSTGIFDADAIYYPLVRSGSIYAIYNHPELDRLIDEARSTLDVNRRRQLYARAERLIHEQAGWVFLWSQKAAFGVSRRLEWKPRADELIWAFDFRIRE